MSLISLRGASSRMLCTCSRVSAWRIRSRRTCVVGWEIWEAPPRKQPLADQPASQGSALQRQCVQTGSRERTGPTQ